MGKLYNIAEVPLEDPAVKLERDSLALQLRVLARRLHAFKLDGLAAHMRDVAGELEQGLWNKAIERALAKEKLA